MLALAAPATASAQSFEPLKPKAVAKISLAKTGLDAPAYARLDRLPNRYGRVGVKAVVESANRDVQSAAGSPSLNQIGAEVKASFKWNNGDNGVDYWIPQGITGSAAARGGRPGRRAPLARGQLVRPARRAAELRQRRRRLHASTATCCSSSRRATPSSRSRPTPAAWPGTATSSTSPTRRACWCSTRGTSWMRPRAPRASTRATAGCFRRSGSTRRTVRARCASPRSRPTAAGRRSSPAPTATRRLAGWPCAGRCGATT